MSVSAWLRRPGCPSSPPESSHAGGERSPSRRPPNASDSLDASSARGVVARVGSAIRRLRPALAAALLSLPLFAGLTTGAAAQSAVECSTANDEGSYTVPVNWALKPSGVAAGGKFRLLFITSTTRDATATGIATYNTHVQTAAKAGHSAISDSCGNLFKVVGSTSAVDARDNTGTTGTGVEIYWLNGNRLANNYADFYDGSWDDYGRKNESGGDTNDNIVTTGSNNDGTKHSWFLGDTFVVRQGNAGDSTAGPLDESSNGVPGASSHHFYGLSPVFKVEAASEYTISFDPAVYTLSEADGFVDVTGTLSAAQTRAVTIPFRYEFPDPGAGYRNFSPVPWVTVPAGQTSFTLRVPILDNSLFENNDLVVITVPGDASARADLVILDDETARGYATHEASDGSYSCISRGRDILVDDQSGGTIAVQQPGWWVGQPPPGLVVDWDRDNYAVGDTATITFRTSDGSRSCAGIEFWLSVSQSPHQTWNNGLPPQPAVLQFPRDSHRVFVTLGRGQTEVSRSFKVLAPGMAIFQIKKVSNRTPWNLGRLGAKLRDMPTPVDRDGTALTVSRDLWGAGAATEVTATVHPGVYFQSASREVQEDAGTVNLTVAVNPPPATSHTLVYTLSGTATWDDDYNIAGATDSGGAVTVPANAGSVTIPVTIVDDSVDDDGETIVVRLATSGDYRPATPDSVTLTIRNHDPVPEPEVSIAAGAGVTEGGSASFTLTADPAPTAPLDVSVTIAAEGEFGIAAGERTVTIPTTGSYELTLATAGDGVDEPDGSVTATVYAGNGYTVGAASSGTVAIADDDALPAAHPLVKHAPVVKRFFDRITARNQHGNGAAGGWNKRFLKAMGHPDYVDYPQAAVTVADATRIWNHGGPGANTAWNGTVAAVTYAERYFAGLVTPPDPVLIPEISIAAGAGITEGGDAVFTVTADRAPDANLSVALTVSEAQGSDFVAASDEGTKTVTVLAGETSGTLTVKTEDDRADEPDGSVTATLAAGSGYTVAASPQDAASVAVADNDAAGALPVLSVESKSVQEGDGKVTLWATIDPFPSKADFPELYRTTRLKLRTIEGTAWDGVDYVGIPASFGITEACNFHTTLAPNGKHGCRIDEVTILDDSHDDGGETFQLEVGFADNEPAPLRGLGEARGTVTIENSDPLPGAWLARFGRAVAEQALDGITARMAAPRTPGMQGTIAGQSLDFSGGASLSQSPGSLSGAGGASFGGETQAQARGMTMQEVLRGSSFSLTGEADSVGGTLAFWGGTPGAGGLVSGSQFAGNQRGDPGSGSGAGGTAVHLSGETSAALLGTDYAQGPWLVGFALSQSRAEGSYAAIGGDVAAHASDGEVEASLTATIPYAALAVSERLKLWGAAGQGSGDVTVKTALGGSLSADTAWSMAAAGLRGDLLAPSAEGTGPSLALVSDALWVQTASEKTRDLAASESDVSRLRLGLEGSWGLALAGGGNIVPKLELGARHDGGDAETGFGVELGGGLAWRDPGLGLTLDLSGRTLVAHNDGGLEDRGISAQLAFDPEPANGRGLSFGLGQDWGGRAQGGLDTLFTPEPLEDREGSSEAEARWTAEAAWGFPAFDGRFTGSPHVGLGLTTDARDYSLGWRLTPEAATAPDLSFGLRATRRESGNARPEHTVGVDITARW